MGLNDIELEIPLDSYVNDVKEKILQKLGLSNAEIKIIDDDHFLQDQDLFPLGENDSTSFLYKVTKSVFPEKTNDQEEEENSDDYAIPPRSDIELPSFTPPEFESMVQKVIELGFDRESSEKALRVAYFHIEKAIDYLVSGYIPDTPTIEIFDDPQPIISRSPIMENFTPDQQEELLSLFTMFHQDPAVVIQIYEACECDKDSAMEILQSME